MAGGGRVYVLDGDGEFAVAVVGAALFGVAIGENMSRYGVEGKTRPVSRSVARIGVLRSSCLAKPALA